MLLPALELVSLLVAVMFLLVSLLVAVMFLLVLAEEFKLLSLSVTLVLPPLPAVDIPSLPVMLLP
jgi:hypothetical protein